MNANVIRGRYAPGHRVNAWTLLESPVSKRHRIFCRCDCGRIVRRKAETILDGSSSQCASCRTRKVFTTHGASSRLAPRDRLYGIWKAMKRRCSSPNGKYAYLYFWRGIEVCDEWLADFTAFRDWSMANGYQPHLTLDRRDNGLGYSPDNCRWVTTKVQARNKRHVMAITAFGETKLLVEWFEDERCVVGFETLRGRLNKNWPPELAMTAPPLPGQRKESLLLAS